jgi:hypothetical protein
MHVSSTEQQGMPMMHRGHVAGVQPPPDDELDDELDDEPDELPGVQVRAEHIPPFAAAVQS